MNDILFESPQHAKRTTTCFVCNVLKQNRYIIATFLHYVNTPFPDHFVRVQIFQDQYGITVNTMQQYKTSKYQPTLSLRILVRKHQPLQVTLRVTIDRIWTPSEIV